MIEIEPIWKIQAELEKGMSLKKCRKCGCMRETLGNFQTSISSMEFDGSTDLLESVKNWMGQMEEIKYSCLGCEYCFPAVAENLLYEAFPGYDRSSLSCDTEVKKRNWPVPGEYFVLCNGETCSVAVSTLASVELAERIAKQRPKEVCIVGKTETENIGIDKVIKNTISNQSIRTMILAGREPEGHFSGKTLYQLLKNGIDENMRVIHSPAKRPILMNVTEEEVQLFRDQVQMVDLVGCEDPRIVVEKAKELVQTKGSLCGWDTCEKQTGSLDVSSVDTVQAQEPRNIEMDKSGYFVIIPQPEKGIIAVEHYSYDNRLVRNIEGKNARDVYMTIIHNGWVTQLSHAAYLGKELEKAELSIKLGLKYVQDAA